MKRKSYKIKKITALYLVVAMMLSFPGCGEKEIDKIQDYGGEEAKKVAVEEATAGDSKIKTTTSTLREIYGQKVRWDETISITEANVTDRKVPMELHTGLYCDIPDIEGMNVYEVSASADFENEESFANGFFDDGATKLEQIKYENSTKYMTMLYQYRGIKGEFETAEESDEEDMLQASLGVSVIYQNGTGAVDTIDSSFGEIYEWIDTDHYYIHMYHGTFQKIDYGLILAYSSKLGKRYIFFDPIDIKDYYPDQDFLTLVYEASEDASGNKLPNEYNTDISNVKDIARKFLAEKIHIPEAENIVSTDYRSYSYSSPTTNLLNQYDYGMNNKAVTDLAFTNSDYVTTFASIGMSGNARGVSILAEQEDQVRDYAKKTKSDNPFQAVESVLNSTSPNPNMDIVRDGYAVYLGTPFDIYENTVSNENLSPRLNNGMIKVTSKGFYGADLILGQSITDVTEKVELLDFEKIKESFVAELEKNMQRSDLGGSDSLHMQLMYLTYGVVKDKESGVTKIVPAWDFELTTDGSVYITLSLNAMDGSVIDYNAINFNDYSIPGD